MRATFRMIVAVDSMPPLMSASLTCPSSSRAKSRRWPTICWIRFRAVARSVDQALDVLQGVGHVHPLAKGFDPFEELGALCADQIVGRAVHGQQVAHLADVALEHRDVVRDEGDGVVDLVGDPGNHLAQAGELLRLDHATLRLLQVEVRLVFGVGHLLEPDVLLDELLLRPFPFGHVPEDSLDPTERPRRVAERRLDHVDVKLFALRRDVLLDGLEDVARLEHLPIVVAVLLGQGRRKEIKIGFADDILQRQPQGIAEFLIAEGEPAFQVLAQDALGKALDQRMMESLRGPQRFIDPPALGQLVLQIREQPAVALVQPVDVQRHRRQRWQFPPAAAGSKVPQRDRSFERRGRARSEEEVEGEARDRARHGGLTIAMPECRRAIPWSRFTPGPPDRPTGIASEYPRRAEPSVSGRSPLATLAQPKAVRNKNPREAPRAGLERGSASSCARSARQRCGLQW